MVGRRSGLMPEIYWLLLILAGVAGWYLAYIIYRPKSKQKIPGEYLRVNYLLNEQPDKALEVFIELVDVDPETVRPISHWHMFRRGEAIGRSASIKPGVRPTLSSIHRSTALLELAKDISRPVSWTGQNPCFWSDPIGCKTRMRTLCCWVCTSRKRSGQGVETAKSLKASLMCK